MKNLTDKELYNLCQKYGANAKMWGRKFASLLPEVEKRKLYRKYKFHSIYEFTAKLAGMSKKTTMEILRVNRKLEDKPLLKSEIEEQGWSKVKVVATVATPETDKMWAEKVKTLPKRALEAFVRECRPGATLQPEETLKWISFKVDKYTEFKLKRFKQKMERERKEPITLGEVIKVLLEKAENPENGKSVKKSYRPKPKPAKTCKPCKITLRERSRFKSAPSIKISRYIPKQREREVVEKYHGKCAFPECNKPARVLHHPDRWALTHTHRRLVPLCTEHHHIAHSGLIGNEHKEPALWRIRAKPDKKSPKFRIDQKFRRKLLARPGNSEAAASA